MKKISRLGIVFLIVLSLVVMPLCGFVSKVIYAEDIGTELGEAIKDNDSDVFQTISDHVVQKWILGDNGIVFDATEQELEYQKYLSTSPAQDKAMDKSEILELCKKIEEDINKLFEDEEKSEHPAKESTIRFVKKGLFPDYETVTSNIDNNITVVEASQLLNSALGYDIAESLELDFEEDDVLTPEVMTTLFTAAFELDEEEITELDSEINEQITNGDFYTILSKYL